MRTTRWLAKTSRSIWSWWRSVVGSRVVGTEEHLANVIWNDRLSMSAL